MSALVESVSWRGLLSGVLLGAFWTASPTFEGEAFVFPAPLVLWGVVVTAAFAGVAVRPVGGTYGYGAVFVPVVAVTSWWVMFPYANMPAFLLALVATRYAPRMFIKAYREGPRARRNVWVGPEDSA